VIETGRQRDYHADESANESESVSVIFELVEMVTKRKKKKKMMAQSQ
jgi:hypothetical protein